MGVSRERICKQNLPPLKKRIEKRGNNKKEKRKRFWEKYAWGWVGCAQWAVQALYQIGLYIYIHSLYVWTLCDVFLYICFVSSSLFALAHFVLLGSVFFCCRCISSILIPIAVCIYIYRAWLYAPYWLHSPPSATECYWSGGVVSSSRCRSCCRRLGYISIWWLYIVMAMVVNVTNRPVHLELFSCCLLPFIETAKHNR